MADILWHGILGGRTTQADWHVEARTSALRQIGAARRLVAFDVEEKAGRWIHSHARTLQRDPQAAPAQQQLDYHADEETFFEYKERAAGGTRGSSGGCQCFGPDPYAAVKRFK